MESTTGYTFTLCERSLTSPGIGTRLKGPTAFSVSTEKTLAKSGKQNSCQSSEAAPVGSNQSFGNWARACECDIHMCTHVCLCMFACPSLLPAESPVLCAGEASLLACLQHLACIHHLTAVLPQRVVDPDKAVNASPPHYHGLQPTTLSSPCLSKPANTHHFSRASLHLPLPI